MKTNWVIFDADNTLWDIEHLYDNARNELCHFLEDKGFDRHQIENFQRNRDVELCSTYGYSACRFARSFEDTVIEYLGGSCKNDDVIHVRKIALDVFEKKPKYDDSLNLIFDELKQRRFKIGLLTAGEKWVQEKRIAEFHLTNEIDAIDVVEKKTKEVISDFIVNNKIDRKHSWMVGDSLKSDIKPSIDSGLKAVWYKNHNWKENENQEDVKDYKYYKITKLNELIGIIDGSK